MADEDQILNRLWPVKLFSTPLVNCIMTWHIVWRYVKMTACMNDLYSNYTGKWMEEISVVGFRRRSKMAFFQSTGCFHLSCWVETGLVCTDGMRSTDTLLSLRAMSHVTHVWPGMSCPLRHNWSRKSASVTLFHFHLHPNASVCACVCVSIWVPLTARSHFDWSHLIYILIHLIYISLSKYIWIIYILIFNYLILKVQFARKWKLFYLQWNTKGEFFKIILRKSSKTTKSTILISWTRYIPSLLMPNFRFVWWLDWILSCNNPDLLFFWSLKMHYINLRFSFAITGIDFIFKIY